MGIKAHPVRKGKRLDTSIVIPAGEAGVRLDQALGLLLPDLSVNARRKLIEAGAVRLDGRRVRKGDRVAAGQTLSVTLPEPTVPAPPDVLPDGLRIVARNDRYAAIAKPAGMHTENLPGRESESVERYLPLLLDVEAVLLNRLDSPTSGLVLAALLPQAVEAYGLMQDRGQTYKRYLAVVRGRLECPLDLRRALDTDDRRTVRLKDKDDPEPVRHTRVTPLRYAAAAEVTLVEAVIRKGRRHQIRAHLAGAGHPIVGDDVYGGHLPGDLRLFLHHAELTFPGFRAYDPPDWPIFKDNAKD